MLGLAREFQDILYLCACPRHLLIYNENVKEAIITDFAWGTSVEQPE